MLLSNRKFCFWCKNLSLFGKSNKLIQAFKCILGRYFGTQLEKEFKESVQKCGRHSSMVLSAPTILRPRVRISSSPSMLFFNLYWNCIEKRTKINKKEAGIGPFLRVGSTATVCNSHYVKNYFLKTLKFFNCSLRYISNCNWWKVFFKYPVIADMFFLNGPTPASFFIYFRLFKHTLQFLQQINVKNVHPVHNAGIWTHNL